MQGRPYLRFLYVENAVGDRPLITSPDGGVAEDSQPVRPYGRLGQVGFVVDDGSNVYDASYITIFGTIAETAAELADARDNADPKLPIYDLVNNQVLGSNKATVHKADFLFLIDDSGSMGDEITRLKASIGSLFSALVDAGISDIRVGVAAYDTIQKAFRTGEGSAWAIYPLQAQSMITTLTVGTTGSSNYSAWPWTAINWALANYIFRDGNHEKHIVLITDAGNEGDPLAYTDVTGRLVADGIKLDIVGTNQALYEPAATATGGTYNDSVAYTDWTPLLVNRLGADLVAAVVGPEVPTVWTAEQVSGGGGQYLLPPEDVGIGHFIYDEYHKKFYFCDRLGRFQLIDTGNGSGSGGEVSQTISATAGIAVTAGQLLAMNFDQTVGPASFAGGKAVGFALGNADAGDEVEIQILGIFTGYRRATLVPGMVYFQTEDGELLQESLMPRTLHGHPAALAIASNSFIILTETNGSSSITDTGIVYLQNGVVIGEDSPTAPDEIVGIVYLSNGVTAS